MGAINPYHQKKNLGYWHEAPNRFSSNQRFCIQRRCIQWYNLIQNLWIQCLFNTFTTLYYTTNKRSLIKFSKSSFDWAEVLPIQISPFKKYFETFTRLSFLIVNHVPRKSKHMQNIFHSPKYRPLCRHHRHPHTLYVIYKRQSTFNNK